MLALRATRSPHSTSAAAPAPGRAAIGGSPANYAAGLPFRAFRLVPRAFRDPAVVLNRFRRFLAQERGIVPVTFRMPDWVRKSGARPTTDMTRMRGWRLLRHVPFIHPHSRP